MNSAEEAKVSVFVHDGQRILQRLVLGAWFVGMPLQITAHPVEAPLRLGPDVPDARHRRVTGRGLVSPVGPNLEQVDRLPYHGIPDIQHGADVLGWATTLHEPLQRGEVCGSFEIGEGHGDAGGDGSGIGGDVTANI